MVFGSFYAHCAGYNMLFVSQDARSVRAVPACNRHLSGVLGFLQEISDLANTHVVGVTKAAVRGCMSGKLSVAAALPSNCVSATAIETVASTITVKIEINMIRQSCLRLLTFPGTIFMRLTFEIIDPHKEAQRLSDSRNLYTELC